MARESSPFPRYARQPKAEGGEDVKRREAWSVAQSAGQIVRRVPGDEKNGGTLFSENLY